MRDAQNFVNVISNSKIRNVININNAFMLSCAHSVGTIDGVSSRITYSGTPHTSKHPPELTRILPIQS